MPSADVAIIGAGISGLMAAAFLAREGRAVVVLERHHRPGGCLSGFRRQGYTFDAGAQSFESLGLLFPLLDELGCLAPLAVQPADYRLRTPSVDCPLSEGLEAVEEAFCRGHPRAAPNLHRFFGRVFRISRAFGRFAQPGRTPFLYEGWDRAKALLRLGVGDPRGVWELWRGHHIQQLAFARQQLDDPGLATLLGTLGYRDATLFSFAAFLTCWQSDYWRPAQGTRQVPKVLADKNEALGVALRVRTAAERIEVQGDRVVGVRTTDGELVQAPVVIAACDHTHLECDLLGLPSVKPEPDEVSDSFVTLFLGLEQDESELDEVLPEHHAFLAPNHRDWRLDPRDRDAHRHRWIVVSRSSRGCRHVAPPGCSTLTVQTMSRADWHGWWGRGRDGARTARYRELKEQVAEQLLETLEQFCPGVRPRIRLRIAATPWSYQRYTGNIHGATAGWSWDPAKAKVREQLGANLGVSSTIRTNIRGLYRCGHWTSSPGSVPGAGLSGWEAYRAIRADGK